MIVLVKPGFFFTVFFILPANGFPPILEFRGKILEFRVKILSLERKKNEKSSLFTYLF